MNRSCPGSNELIDDSYRDWRYPNGIVKEKCTYCNAVRTLVVKSYSLGIPGCSEQGLFFPYHKRVTKS